MKSFNRKSLVIAGLCALAVSLGSAAYAEKGAETLVRLNKAPALAVQTSTAVTPAHNCPTCTDTLVSVADKGAKKPTYVAAKVVRHDCTSCATKITTAGTGKAMHNVAIHSCGADVKAACCASK